MEKFQTSEHLLKDEDGNKNVFIFQNKDRKIERHKAETEKNIRNTTNKRKKTIKKLEELKKTSIFVE